MARTAVTRDRAVVVWVLVMLGVLSMKAKGDVCGKPTSVNGCSVPLQLPFFYKDVFTPACNRHDICYGCGAVYGLSRADCDQAFLQDMLFACSLKNTRVRRHAPPRHQSLRHLAKLHAARARYHTSKHQRSGPQSLGFEPRDGSSRASRYRSALQHPELQYHRPAGQRSQIDTTFHQDLGEQPAMQHPPPLTPRADGRGAAQHVSREPPVPQQTHALNPHAASLGTPHQASRHRAVLQHRAVTPHAKNRIWPVSPQVSSSVFPMTGDEPVPDRSRDFLITDKNAGASTATDIREKFQKQGPAEGNRKLRDRSKNPSKVSYHETQKTHYQAHTMSPSHEGTLHGRMTHGDPKGHRDTTQEHKGHSDTKEHNGKQAHHPRVTSFRRRPHRTKRETWCRTFARNVYYPAVHAFGASHFMNTARAELYCMQAWVSSCLPVVTRPR